MTYQHLKTRWKIELPAGVFAPTRQRHRLDDAARDPVALEAFLQTARPRRRHRERPKSSSHGSGPRVLSAWVPTRCGTGSGSSRSRPPDPRGRQPPRRHPRTAVGAGWKSSELRRPLRRGGRQAGTARDQHRLYPPVGTTQSLSDSRRPRALRFLRGNLVSAGEALDMARGLRVASGETPEEVRPTPQPWREAGRGSAAIRRCITLGLDALREALALELDSAARLAGLPTSPEGLLAFESGRRSFRDGAPAGALSAWPWMHWVRYSTVCGPRLP